TYEARRHSADASAKANQPKPLAQQTPHRGCHRKGKKTKTVRATKAQTQLPAHSQKTRQKKRRTPKAYFDARSTTYLTYPEDINKPVNKNCG
ncbi:hypothetical protein, partial [Paraburkholderia hospita]|uniref:hypothetical protein n=1 Tax=Paraburkholderia hospita TaxID=169430 RepID=UPI001A98ACAC